MRLGRGSAPCEACGEADGEDGIVGARRRPGEECEVLVDRALDLDVVAEDAGADGACADEQSAARPRCCERLAKIARR
eukprot:scaffold109078_cov63-Phaeocystis_antarctica.AAC.2